MKNNNYQIKFISIICLIIMPGITMLLTAQANSDGSFPQYLFSGIQ